MVVFSATNRKFDASFLESGPVLMTLSFILVTLREPTSGIKLGSILFRLSHIELYYVALNDLLCRPSLWFCLEKLVTR